MIWETFKQLAIILGGTATFVVVIGWLARSIVQQLLSKDLENYKNELKAQNDIEIERLKSDLKMQAFEHETRFRKLHEEVAKTLAETYPLLHRVFDSVIILVSSAEYEGGSTKEETLKLVAENSKKFSTYFYEHAIYYPKTLYGQIDEFHTLLVQTTNKFSIAYTSRRMGEPTGLDQWHETFATINLKGRILFEVMKDEFRKTLGFKDTE